MAYFCTQGSKLEQELSRAEVGVIIAHAMSNTKSKSMPSLKRHWWQSNKMLAEKNVKKGQHLLRSQESADIFSALNLLDFALELWPKCEKALELKARALLYLRRFKDVASMLEEYIPSMTLLIDPSVSQPVSDENMSVISSCSGVETSVSKSFLKHLLAPKFKTLIFTRMSKKSSEQGGWKYLVLGQACCHLGMMEDAMILLQIGKKAASLAFRRESGRKPEDSFSLEISASESEVITQMLGSIKILLRRRAAGLAALDAGFYLDSARHFSKILDGKKGTPQGFIAECYMHRAVAYQASGRMADAIADCNRTLALEPTCIEALTIRASIFETIRCYTECLQDLEHLKMLYESILRNQNLSGPVWKQRVTRYKDVKGSLDRLKFQINDILRILFTPFKVDYCALLSLRKGSCTRSEVECAHRVLSLRHRPDKAAHFVERCEFVDCRDIEAVKEQARTTAAMLYRMLQKARTSVMASIMEEEAEKHKMTTPNKVRTDSEQALFVRNNKSWDGRANSYQSYYHPESVHNRTLSSGPRVAEFSHALKQVCPWTTSTTDSTFTKSSSVVDYSKQDGMHRISISTKASDFGVYNKEDAIPTEFLDSGVIEAVSCRDMVGLGTMLSRALRQGHNITPLEAI